MRLKQITVVVADSSACTAHLLRTIYGESVDLFAWCRSLFPSLGDVFDTRSEKTFARDVAATFLEEPRYDDEETASAFVDFVAISSGLAESCAPFALAIVLDGECHIRTYDKFSESFFEVESLRKKFGFASEHSFTG